MREGEKRGGTTQGTDMRHSVEEGAKAVASLISPPPFEAAGGRLATKLIHEWYRMQGLMQTKQV